MVTSPPPSSSPPPSCLKSVDLKTSSFTEVSSPLTHTTITGDAPLVLDTPTQVFLWLPMSYWEGKEERKTALEISEVSLNRPSPQLLDGVWEQGYI